MVPHATLRGFRRPGLVVAAGLLGALGLFAAACTPPGASTQVTQVGAGSAHTCAVMTDGRVTCWGLNTDGQVGNGVFTGGVAVPLTVAGVSGARQVVGGQQHTCALVAGGKVKCWGDNGLHQVGDGTTTPQPTPVPVVGLTDVVQIAGIGDNYCALLGDGTVRCWGFGRQGQMGNGTDDDVNPLPVEVTGLVGASQLSASGGHTCAVVATGAVRCWGANSSGTLGDGTTTDRSVPVAAIGLRGVRQVEAGGAFTCAVLANRTLTCWGENVHGQLGTGLGGSTTTPGALVKF